MSFIISGLGSLVMLGIVHSRHFAKTGRLCGQANSKRLLGSGARQLIDFDIRLDSRVSSQTMGTGTKNSS